MTYDLSDPRDYRRAMNHLMWKDHGLLRVHWTNMRPVGGQMWRSNQPSPARLEQLAQQGFKTILNLRGTQPGRSYYELEREACARLGLEMIDMPWGSREAPYVERIESALEIFSRIEYPALMHCKSGADRAGIVSVIYLIAHESRPFEEAMTHLSLRYHHVKQGKTGMLDHFFDLYRQANAQRPIDFMDWVRTEYDRQACHDGFMASWWGSFITEKLLRRE
ncbi:MAG: dual specificity protein phosphatase family protein [Maricaulaceae bacterium]|nr:dual specificity protein phosphatase family protein [Maricaulaceae bacterium]